MSSRRKKFNAKAFSYVAIGLALSFWAGWGYMLFMVRPITWEHIYYAPFLILLWLALCFSFVLTGKKIIYLVIPTGIVAIVLLRLLGFKEWYFPVLIVACAASLVYFFTAKEKGGTVREDNSNN